MDERQQTRIRALLNDSTEQLDPEIRRRLRQARQRALDAAPARRPFWQPAAALALTCLLLLFVVIRPGEQARLPEATPGELDLADLDLISADDSLQLYEDLDFYQWLLENENHAG